MKTGETPFLCRDIHTAPLSLSLSFSLSPGLCCLRDLLFSKFSATKPVVSSKDRHVVIEASIQQKQAKRAKEDKRMAVPDLPASKTTPIKTISRSAEASFSTAPKHRSLF